MSLQAAWDGIQAGCVAVPQHGYFANEPLASYRIVWSKGGSRHSLTFREPVYAEFDCPSPPASFRFIIRERNPPSPGYDPSFRIDAFLGVCGSMGVGLGTSRWFGMAVFNFTIVDRLPISPDWMHVCYYGTNDESFGLVSYLGSPP